jgi:hypothetical protein
MRKYFESDDILGIIWRWKKPLGIILVAASFVAVIISSPLIIKPKFKSYVVAYPSNLSPYSEESPSEQMLQFLESDVIRDQLIEEFNLMHHYGIDEDDRYKLNNLYEEYSDNFSFSKTKYESVSIEVLDYKPDTAFLLVNRLVELYNEEVKKLQDAQVSEGVKTLRKQLEEKSKQIDSLELKINDLRVNFGILDYESQAENITKEIYKMLGRRSYDPDKLNELKKERDQLEQKGGEFERLRQSLYNLREEYSSIRLNYEQQYKELLRNKSYSNIVVNAYKSDKKVYPIRWLICVIFVGSIMIMAMGVISFMDRVNRDRI